MVRFWQVFGITKNWQFEYTLCHPLANYLEYTLQTAVTMPLFTPFVRLQKFTSQKADEHYIKYIKTSGVCYPQYT